MIVHGVPDVTIDKAHTGAFVRGQQGTFSLIVEQRRRPRDDGRRRDRRHAAGRPRHRRRERRRLDLRASTRPPTRCTASAATRSRSGAAFPAVSVLVNVLESAPDTLVNTGVTGGGGETNTDQQQRRRHRRDHARVADVAIVKSVAPTTTPPGVERHLHAGRDEQRAVDRQGRQGLRSAAGRHDVRLGDAGRLRPRADDGDVLARRSRQGPERDDHARLGRPAGAREEDADERGDRHLDDARPEPRQQQGHARPSRSPPRRPRSCGAQDGDAARRSGRATRVVFTIVLTVPSKVDAKQVDVCDTLPAALVFESAPGATFSKGRACWHLDVAKAGLDDDVHDHGQGRRRRRGRHRPERRRRHGRQRPAGSRRARRSGHAGPQRRPGPRRAPSPARAAGARRLDRRPRQDSRDSRRSAHA